jgi:hypothetical protein
MVTLSFCNRLIRSKRRLRAPKQKKLAPDFFRKSGPITNQQRNLLPLEHPKLRPHSGGSCFFNAVLSENDSFLMTAEDLPLLAAFKSLFFDSVVNGPLGIL